MRRITLMLLCCVGLWSCVAASRGSGPTAHGYSFHASAVPNALFLPSDLVSSEDYPSTATLLVQVHQDGVACHTGARSCLLRYNKCS